ncbi:NUDIX family hydrolase [Aaosphaeria arxii CBS 175.79]|uniref:NUDIX family hydrolase n=1 Tax=Aaosphaeria arxii CBS 175.79 TaxID=1450172 RepID=A0A6A5XPJ2_9PLEO|nr:NUDIX family hydrolase [Aaosphaeria arxii CBS 175.79]KAF2014863.1 NUDIX family hydrolase [Aaosphaeria arxii CBS 175.79]
MSVFKLHKDEGFGDSVEVTLTRDIKEEQLQNWAPFKNWKSTLRTNLEAQADPKHVHNLDPYSLQSITIQSVDWFGNRIGFIKLYAEIQNSKTDLPGIAFLRGGSVAVLMVLRPEGTKDERYVIMTEQPRIPAGSLRFLEIPAGMLDGEVGFRGKAADEIDEETGIKIRAEELIDLTGLALKNSKVQDELQPAMYPSAGGSDEFIPIYLWEKEMDRQRIVDLQGQLTGKRMQGEMITLKVTDYEELWREGARDAKTLAAWALYEGLSRAGILQPEIDRLKKASGSSTPIES